MGRLAALYPELISKLCKQFIQYLISKLENSNNCSKIRGHAASALINLCNPSVDEEHNAKAALKEYMEPILNAIVTALQGAALEIRLPCLSLLGLVYSH